MGGCSVKDCKSSSYKGMRLFRFPSNETRRKLWAKICRRDDWVPTTNARLCSLHFTEDQFENARVDGWRKLKPNAVPTIFVGTVNDKTTKSVYFQRSQQVLLDHSYSGQNSVFHRIKRPAYFGILNQPSIPVTVEEAKCVVPTCSNNSAETKKLNLEVSYYKFPQDEEIRNCWIEACNREISWNPSDSAICSMHFRENDFELDLQSLLFNMKNERKLKWTAIPTLHLPKSDDKGEEITIKVEESDNSTEEDDEEEEIVINCDPTETPTDYETLNEVEESDNSTEEDEEDEEEEIMINCDPTETPTDYETLYEDHEALKSKYDTLHESCIQQSREIECLEDKILQLTKRLDEERNSKKQLEKVLRYIYSDQKKEK